MVWWCSYLSVNLSHFHYVCCFFMISCACKNLLFFVRFQNHLYLFMMFYFWDLALDCQGNHFLENIFCSKGLRLFSKERNCSLWVQIPHSLLRIVPLLMREDCPRQKSQTALQFRFQNFILYQYSTKKKIGSELLKHAEFCLHLYGLRKKKLGTWAEHNFFQASPENSRQLVCPVSFNLAIQPSQGLVFSVSTWMQSLIICSQIHTETITMVRRITVVLSHMQTWQTCIFTWLKETLRFVELVILFQILGAYYELREWHPLTKFNP